MFYILVFATQFYFVQLPGQFDSVQQCQSAAHQIVNVMPKKHRPSFLCLSVAVSGDKVEEKK